MNAPLSAVDCISPAFADTKQILFRGFRFGVWLRLAVVAFLTGEFAGGGWGGSTNINLPNSGGKQFLVLLSETNSSRGDWEKYWPWILLAVGVVFLLGFAWLYAASVSRFILFDAILHRRYELRQGWKRWRAQGLGYFFWEVSFAFGSLLALAILAGAPAYFAWRAGWFRNPDAHIVGLVLGAVFLFLAVVILLVGSAVVSLFAKDFLVPVMALEDRGVIDGWRRLLPMLGAEKGAYAGYVLMKIVLAVGSAILFGIVDFFAVLLLMIPIGIVVALAVAVLPAHLFAWNALTIIAAVILSVAALFGVFWAISFVYAPGLVFFQSYTLRFFGSRYPTLGAILNPELPSGVPPPAEPAPAT